MGHDPGPLFRPGRVEWRLSQLEILRTVVVHDQQPVAGWFDVVLDPLPAWCHDPWLTLRLIGAEEPILGGQLLAAPTMIQRSSRLASTPTQNLSSASTSTSVSSAGSVPSRCRRTAYGRQASSTRV